MKISDVLSSLIAAYCDWDQILINPRYMRQGNIITWEDYQPRTFSNPLYLSDLIDIIDEGQYSFQINEDGSIIRLYYSFDARGTLATANLTYISAKEDPENIVGWLRLDYDPINAKGVSHPACHMHWSQFPTCRFIVNGVPSPRQFIELVICSFYSAQYQKIHIDDQGRFINPNRIQTINSTFFHLAEEDYHKLLPNFYIPPAIVT